MKARLNIAILHSFLIILFLLTPNVQSQISNFEYNILCFSKKDVLISIKYELRNVNLNLLKVI